MVPLLFPKTDSFKTVKNERLHHYHSNSSINLQLHVWYLFVSYCLLFLFLALISFSVHFHVAAFYFRFFFLVYCVFIFFWKRIEFCAVFSYRRFQISNQHLVISWANFSLCILFPLRFNACIVCLNVFVHCIYICIDRWLVCLDVCGNFIFYRFIHKSYVQSQAEIQLRIGGGKKGTLWLLVALLLLLFVCDFGLFFNDTEWRKKSNRVNH